MLNMKKTRSMVCPKMVSGVTQDTLETGSPMNILIFTYRDLLWLQPLANRVFSSSPYFTKASSIAIETCCREPENYFWDAGSFNPLQILEINYRIRTLRRNVLNEMTDNLYYQ